MWAGIWLRVMYSIVAGSSKGAPPFASTCTSRV